MVNLNLISKNHIYDYSSQPRASTGFITHAWNTHHKYTVCWEGRTALSSRSFVKPSRFMTQPKPSEFLEEILNYLLQVQQIISLICLWGNEHCRRFRWALLYYLIFAFFIFKIYFIVGQAEALWEASAAQSHGSSQNDSSCAFDKATLMGNFPR